MHSPRLTYLIVTVTIIAAGLLVRWPGLGLAWPIAKYAGSVLWGAMVYAIVRLVQPLAPVAGSAAVAGLIAIIVETSRLLHQPDLDAFRTTLAGQLLLGRFFSVWNIVAYAVGIGCAASLDTASQERSTR